MNKITFVTGNSGKLDLAQTVLFDYGIQVDQQEIDLPEIQSSSVAEVAEFSARFAADQLDKPVFVTDVGYYITALNGFPGPFIKQINNWLTANNLLQLMAAKGDRSMIIKECLAYATPDGQLKSFTTQIQVKIADDKAGQGEMINQVMVLNGFDAPRAICDPLTVRKYFLRHLDHYHDFGKYITTSNNE